MTQIKFFFYHKLKNIDLLRKIDPLCDYQNGHILAQELDDITGRLIPGNSEFISGAMVTFNKPMETILKEINNMMSIVAIEDKSRYSLSTVLVNTPERGVTEAYIIY